MRVRVIGAGIFGVAAALELSDRGHSVVLVDPGPLPHPDAASTDLSKLVRMDYGADALYTELMERAFPRWEQWNRRFSRRLFHCDGMAVLCSALTPGTFEGDSWDTLRARGHPLERVYGLAPWQGYSDGYINPLAGWVESGEVVSELVSWALAHGVEHEAARAGGLDGLLQGADAVVVATGAWLSQLLPELGDRVCAVGQPVLHFQPSDPERWRAPRFLPWAAEIARTGWYGFPANASGIVKIANHGPGQRVDPGGRRVVGPAWEPVFRTFLAEHLPELADAPLVGSRLCLYADSMDGNFWIDAVPDRPRVFVAGGGSGHGFKFAPVLGELIADAVEGVQNPLGARFRWRYPSERGSEHARHMGPGAS